jgi:hypothetical protein
MSGGTKNVVDSKQKGLSPMGTLKDQISFFSAEAQWCFGELVRTYLNDTITPGALDSAQIWIKRANGPTVDKGRQIRLALEMKDSTTAANALQQMIIAEGPNSSNVKVHDAIIKLHKKNIRLTLQTDTVMLNTVQQVYADVNTPDARLLAQSLLSYVNEIPPTPIYELMPVTSSSRFAASSEPNPEKEEKKLLNCYPNPFNQNTTITASVPDGTTNAILIVHDVMGREVARYTLVIGNNEINFNSDNIGKGMLMYSLIIDGNRTETKVMMKE